MILAEASESTIKTMALFTMYRDFDIHQPGSESRIDLGKLTSLRECLLAVYRALINLSWHCILWCKHVYDNRNGYGWHIRSESM